MAERRIRYFVKKKLQFKYMLFVLLAMLVPTALCGGLLYYLIWQTVAAEVAIPEAIAETLIPALDKVNIILFITLPIVFFFMLLASIYISHKIAGPIYRVENELKEILNGNYSRRIKLRSHDELQEIADAINKILDQVQSKQ